VYVLHLSEPLAHARGYVGWAADIARRVAEHLDVEACRQAGFHVASHRGSPLVCAAIRSGRSVIVVQLYPGGDRGLERRLHNRHHPRICPVCRQRPLRPRRIRLRRGVGRAHGPPVDSPRPTARRGGSPVTPVWCCLFWLAIAIWALFVLSSVSWEITR
jgi:hypothetical protein